MNLRSEALRSGTVQIVGHLQFKSLRNEPGHPAAAAVEGT